MAFMQEHSIRPGAGVGDHFTGQLDGTFRDALGFAQVLDFLGRLLATFVHPALRITFDGDASLAREVCENERQRAVAHGVSDASATQAFGCGLRVGGFPIP